MQTQTKPRHPYPIRERAGVFFGHMMDSVFDRSWPRPLLEVAREGLDNKFDGNTQASRLPEALQIRYASRIRDAETAVWFLKYRKYTDRAQDILSAVVLNRGDAWQAVSLIVKDRNYAHIEQKPPSFVTSAKAEQNLARTIAEKGAVGLAVLVLGTKNLQDPEAQKILARKIVEEGTDKNARRLLIGLQTPANKLRYVSRDAPIYQEVIDMLNAKVDGSS